MHRCFKFFFGTSFSAGLFYLFVAISRIPLKTLLKRLIALDGFVLMIWLTLPFFSEDGMRMAALITIRVHAAVLDFYGYCNNIYARIIAGFKSTPHSSQINCFASFHL